MSFFGEIVTLINRAPITLNCRYDGKDVVLQPGENHGFAKVAVIYAKNQNPINGTEDPNNPSIGGCRYLVGVKGSKDNCKPLTKEEWTLHLSKPQRLNRDLIIEERGDPKSREVVKGKKVRSTFEASVPGFSDDMTSNA